MGVTGTEFPGGVSAWAVRAAAVWRALSWFLKNASTAAQRLSTRWKRSTTCIASGVPWRMPSAYRELRSRQTTVIVPEHPDRVSLRGGEPRSTPRPCRRTGLTPGGRHRGWRNDSDPGCYASDQHDPYRDGDRWQ